MVRDALDAVSELRFLLGTKIYDKDRTYRRTVFHRVVLRDEHSDIAFTCLHALHPGTRLHLHGTWRERYDDSTGGGMVDEFVVARLYTELPMSARLPGSYVPIAKGEQGTL
ncbi:hypothetical protein [Streptomyces monomycini]|uniref:hypothetical protein n=1 Tax=Streptomyces monomycini TaxID=371720 RepID=UPI001EEC6654|nr:hypothetical protein [Streptomyces monomycini]